MQLHIRRMYKAMWRNCAQPVNNMQASARLMPAAEESPTAQARPTPATSYAVAVTQEEAVWPALISSEEGWGMALGSHARRAAAVVTAMQHHHRLAAVMSAARGDRAQEKLDPWGPVVVAQHHSCCIQGLGLAVSMK